jgi:hypothetical protein
MGQRDGIANLTSAANHVGMMTEMNGCLRKNDGESLKFPTNAASEQPKKEKLK